ncbi:hypothetical protein BJX62DRAFT_237174 [Aspergillus germanicus]
METQQELEDTADLAPELHDPERASLIEKISELAGIKTVDSATWACLWLADLERLHELLNQFDQNRPGLAYSALTTVENARMLRSWAARSRTRFSDDDFQPIARKRSFEASQSETTSVDEPIPLAGTTSSSSLAGRSEKAKKLCLFRDKGTCLISNASEPVEVCHVFPYTMGKPTGDAKTLFWGILSTFWTTAKVDKWKAQVFGEQRTEIVENLITLCANAHRLWNRARFAFQPVDLSADKKTLTMRFFWLPNRRFTKRQSISEPPNFPATLESGAGNAKFFDHSTDQKIWSNHQIVVTTDDPVSKPLPSMELLRMQWTLNRLIAISGAADVDEDEIDSDDDESTTVAMERQHSQENQPFSAGPARTPRSSKTRESIILPHRPASLR